MKRALFTALLLSQITLAHAAELVIEDPWVRQPPPGAMAAGGFMVLKNTGTETVEVVAVKSDAAGWVEVHRTIEEDGVARMVEQKKLSIPAGGELVLEPGSYHMMMMQPKKIVDGDRVHITIKFSDGTEQTFHAPVLRRMGMKAHHHKH